ncbi:hypothetical protein IFVP22_C290376 [Vibrio parahaemolyticus]
MSFLSMQLGLFYGEMKLLRDTLARGLQT